MAHFAKLLRLLILPLFLLIGAAAFAQTAAPATSGTSSATTDTTGEAELKTLIDVLENDTARADLIDRLKAEAAPKDSAVPDVLSPSEQISFARQIAQLTQETAQSVAASFDSVMGAVRRVPTIFDGLSGLDTNFFVSAFGELLTLIVGTIAFFYLIRRIAIIVFRRLDAKVERASAGVKVVIFVVSLFIDLLLVAAATAFGYAIAVLAIGEVGQIGIRQTLFLNAFWIVGVIRVGVRAILSPAASQMRLLPMGDKTATGLTGWVSLLVSLVGYGQLLLVPVVNREVSYAAGTR